VVVAVPAAHCLLFRVISPLVVVALGAEAVVAMLELEVVDMQAEVAPVISDQVPVAASLDQGQAILTLLVRKLSAAPVLVKVVMALILR
jgi:hypothetical protein